MNRDITEEHPLPWAIYKTYGRKTEIIDANALLVMVIMSDPNEEEGYSALLASKIISAINAKK
jgi:hypothetical protein